MIKRMEIRDNQNSLLSLTLNDPASGFLIEEIGGLGPVKSNLASSSFADIDGAQYQSSRRDPRNITFKINLRQTISDSIFSLRSRLYTFFMTGRQVFIRVVLDDDRIFDIMGYVETCEPSIFTKEPDLNVSIMCFSPNFVNGTATVFNLVTTNTNAAYYINYPGQLSAGILLTVHANRAMTGFTIYNEGPDGVANRLEFTAPLVAGDELAVSTIPGKKSVMRTRDNTYTSMLYAVSPVSKWFKYVPGANIFSVYAEGAPVPYTLVFAEEYGGL